MKHCCEKKCCCDQRKCNHGNSYKGCEEHGHSYSFLKLADCAWMDVLKEKIKEQIEKTDGEHLSELAKIISENNRQRWKHKMGAKRHCREFEENLCCFFGKSKK